jgi:hypothetical protein
METACLSEMLVSTYKSTRRHNPEQHRHLHDRDNLKFILCFDQKEVVWMKLLHEISFMQLISSLCDPSKKTVKRKLVTEEWVKSITLGEY